MATRMISSCEMPLPRRYIKQIPHTHHRVARTAVSRDGAARGRPHRHGPPRTAPSFVLAMTEFAREPRGFTWTERAEIEDATTRAVCGEGVGMEGSAMTYLRAIRRPGLRWIVIAALLASLAGVSPWRSVAGRTATRRRGRSAGSGR
jgi:hypothetical protein